MMSKLGRGFKCADCLTPTGRIGEYYSVTDEVWSLAWSGWRRPRPPDKGLDRMLCIRCLEKRIGRTLNRADFIDCPLHPSDGSDGYWPVSELLFNRLTREPDEEMASAK
jgi:hypothetical protein